MNLCLNDFDLNTVTELKFKRVLNSFLNGDFRLSIYPCVLFPLLSSTSLSSGGNKSVSDWFISVFDCVLRKTEVSPPMRTRDADYKHRVEERREEAVNPRVPSVLMEITLL